MTCELNWTFAGTETNAKPRYSGKIRLQYDNQTSSSREAQWSVLLPKKVRQFEIKQSPLDVLSFVEIIQRHADSHREEFGFLAARVYGEAARAGTLFVAVESGVQGNSYRGHILFGASYPHARIHQVFVSPMARKDGVGRILVESVISLAEKKQFLSVTAKVAAELPANAFWHSLGFETLRTKDGGATRKRTINIRVRQLNSPALFGYREPVSGLPLAEPMPSYTPVFALDLNIFFDVAKTRPRAEYGAEVMSAGFNNIVRLTVTDEFAKELRRSPSPTASDPILEFALTLPTLPVPVGGIDQEALEGLARIVFPDRASNGKLTVQDKSDLAHLAIASHHKITGFVTAEDALVAASSTIEKLYGIKVIHVSRLAALIKNAEAGSSPLEIGFAEGDLRLSEVDASHHYEILRLADSLKLPNELRALVLAQGVQAGTRRSLVISLNTEVVCAAFWRPQPTLHGTLEAVLLADEDQVSAEVALDALLNRLSHCASSQRPTRVQLLIPNACLAAQRFALHWGFTRCPGTASELSLFQRLSIGAPITASSWPSIRRDLENVADMIFPEVLPEAKKNDVRIHFKNRSEKEFVIDLFDLETALSPTLFLLPQRSGVLVPIRSQYADELLGTATQGSLLPTRQAGALHARTYFSSPRNLRLLSPGTPVVFYESGNSGGRCAAIALARVRSTVVVSKRKTDSNLIECGVLDQNDLAEITVSEKVAATTLDNVMKLRKPVDLKRLRALGCVDGSNAVTSRQITAEQLHQLIEEGQGTYE